MAFTEDSSITGFSPWRALIDVLYEPAKTFKQLEPRPQSWYPMVVLMASVAALMIWYFSMVDFPWLLDHILTGIRSAEEREQAATIMSKEMLQGSTLGGALAMWPITFVLMGAYIMIVSKALSHGMSFGQGFGLAAWSSVPGILLLPLGAIQILMEPSGQLSFSDLNPFSLNQLLFHFDMAHPLAELTDSVNVITLWSVFLLIIGVELWAKVKRSTATLIVAIPYLIIYGVWFVYSMSKLA